ncbi:MAG: hypothetical protein ACE5GD_06290 [Candidatus Geothermarchaeales archaeon]
MGADTIVGVDLETMEWENRVMDELIGKANVERYLRRVLRQVISRKR